MGFLATNKMKSAFFCCQCRYAVFIFRSSLLLRFSINIRSNWYYLTTIIDFLYSIDSIIISIDSTMHSIVVNIDSSNHLENGRRLLARIFDYRRITCITYNVQITKFLFSFNQI